MSKNKPGDMPGQRDRERDERMRRHQENLALDLACAEAIDKMVIVNFAGLRSSVSAAESLLIEFGAERVCRILATSIICNAEDPHISDGNKKWARNLQAKHRRFQLYKADTDPILLDALATQVRRLSEEREQPAGTQDNTFNPLAAAEMISEQNHNMIDGVLNNIGPACADLTDGQTWDEIRELAPESLPEEKHSVMDQLCAARQAPPVLDESGAPAAAKRREEPEH